MVLLFNKGCMAIIRLGIFIILTISFFPIAKADPLPSWNDGEIKKSIIDFVVIVTDPANHNYVAPQNRIATLDNDGTLWVEKPVYTQILFAIARVKTLAPQHPEWRHQRPFSFILREGKLSDFTSSMEDIKQLLIATHTGMSIETYHRLAKEWLDSAKNPRFQLLYKNTVYQPMLELIAYLQNNNFQVYIVTGGGQEFVRAYAEEVYGIDSAHVIGTLGETKYENVNNKPELIKTPVVAYFDDGKKKPPAINYFIGRKPIIAFGNSDGDKQMLEWTQSGNGLHLMFLIHHDDAVREYAYGTDSKIGTFSDALMQEALQNHWKIISMKKDWKTIFPFKQTKVGKKEIITHY
jgi:phosphoserine phosphatase